MVKLQASFRFPLTTSTTHRVIAHLIDVGVEKSKIHNSVYDTNSFGRLQLLGCALNNLRFLENFKTAYIKNAFFPCVGSHTTLYCLKDPPT